MLHSHLSIRVVRVDMLTMRKHFMGRYRYVLWMDVPQQNRCTLQHPIWLFGVTENEPCSRVIDNCYNKVFTCNWDIANFHPNSESIHCT
jgi:hypothetical protein